MIKRKDITPKVIRAGYHSISYNTDDTMDTLTEKLNLFLSENNIKVINVETYLSFFYEEQSFYGIRLWYTELKPLVNL
jgi:hypothetical protein